LIKAVLIDLDDTIYDHRGATLAGLEAVRAHRPGLRRKTGQELLAAYLRLLEELHPRVLSGDLADDEARRARMRGIFALAGEAPDAAAVEEAIGVYRRVYQASRRPVAGAAALLDALQARALPVVVVTNSVVEEQREKLRHCRFEWLAAAMVVSEDVGVRKPDPGIFAVALARAGCAAAEAAMLGDSWPNDVVGARAAGVGRVVWLNRAGVACPAPGWATEVQSLLPTEALLAALGVG
jgi:putative hydrolase of the HAD superfamily